VTKYRTVVGRKLYDLVASYCCTLEQSLNCVFYTSAKLTDKSDVHQTPRLLARFCDTGAAYETPYLLTYLLTCLYWVGWVCKLMDWVRLG